MKVSLTSGAYTTRSVIADNQRCVNLYPEINPQDAEQPVTHYCTPGLTLKLSGQSGMQVAPVRGLYFATNGQLYCVCGTGVYYVDSDFTAHLLGAIASKSTPVSMVDNGTTLVLVDGTAEGYTITLASNTFAVLVDPTGLFVGADRVDYVDTYLLFNVPGTNQFYSSLSNVVQFDATYIAGKTSFPDNLQTIIVNHRIIWLLGQFTSEPWYDAGNPAFPFALQPGVFVQYGCAAKYSASSDGDMIFWLSQDKNGNAMVLAGQGFVASILSTPAISQEFSTYTTISDAIGFCYQQGGHSFYVISFPTMDKTWVYDKSTKLWHERSTRDGNGVEHRHRANCHAFAYGYNLVGDWQNGDIYALDLNAFTDNGLTVTRRRGFPYLVNDGKRVHHVSFMADIEVGTTANTMKTGEPNAPVQPDFSQDFNSDANIAQSEALPDTYTGPLITLRWSDDRGRTWGDPVTMPLGASGQYLTTPTWRRLGVAKYRIYELIWDAPTSSALQGAFVEVIPAGT